MIAAARPNGSDPRAPREVAITGLGAVTAYGVGWPALRDGVRSGRPAHAPAGRDLPGAEELPAGLARDLSAFRTAFPELRPPLPGKRTRMLLLAAKEALDDARLPHDQPRPDLGLVINCTWGADAVAARLHDTVLELGAEKTSPLLFSQTVANSSSGEVARHLGPRGPLLVTVGGGALELARLGVAGGECDAMLCGGLDELEANRLLALGAGGHVATSATATDGPAAVAAEAAVVVVLEELQTARARGAAPDVLLRSVHHVLGRRGGGAGWGEPDPDEIAETLRAALAQAGRAADEVFVVTGAHGRGPVDAALGRALDGLGVEPGRRTTLAPLAGETFGAAALLATAWAADRLRAGEAARPAALVAHVEYGQQLFATVLEAGAA